MKTIYRTYLTIACFFLGTTVMLSQNQDWSAESPLVTVNGTDVEINSVLTKQGSGFTWLQNGYNTTTSNVFTVNAVTGSWDAQDQLGELVYTLTLDNVPASLRVVGTPEDIVMELTVHNNGDPTPDTYTFLIETTNNL